MSSFATSWAGFATWSIALLANALREPADLQGPRASALVAASPAAEVLA
jgi:hypothetical protein